MTWWWQWQSFFSLATPLRSDEADFILCSEMAYGLAPGTLLSTLSLIANQAQLKNIRRAVSTAHVIASPRTF